MKLTKKIFTVDVEEYYHAENIWTSLSPEENFEQALKSIADSNVIVRRMLKRR